MAPTVKAQRYITPGLACACGLDLGDPSAGSTIEVVAEELGPSRASAGDGEHDQDDEEPALAADYC